MRKTKCIAKRCPDFRANTHTHTIHTYYTHYTHYTHILHTTHHILLLPLTIIVQDGYYGDLWVKVQSLLVGREVSKEVLSALHIIVIYDGHVSALHVCLVGRSEGEGLRG